MARRTVYRIIICPAANQATANEVAAVLDPEARGDRSFVVGVSPTGSLPITHYVCSVLLMPETAALLDNLDAAPTHLALMAKATERQRSYQKTPGDLQALRDVLVVAPTLLSTYMGKNVLSFVSEVPV